MKKLVLGLLILVFTAPSFATIYTISSGYFGAKTIKYDDTLFMTGGGGDSLTGKDYSSLYISNTSPLVLLSGGIWSLAIDDHSQLYLSGGQVNQLFVDDYATAVLSGGKINYLENDSQGGYASVEIVCRSYNYNTTTKLLTGVWENYSPFSIQLVDLSGYATTYSILDFTIIPEPATMLLLGLGGLLLRRRN